MSGRRHVVRLVLVGLILTSVATVAYSASTNEPGIGEADLGTRVAPPSNGTTVVATDSNSWLGRESNGPRASSELLVVGPDGRLQYYNDTYTHYWDVDPVPGTDATVQYVAAQHLPLDQCGVEACTRNVVERVNLTTGETERLYARITPGKHSTRWHDADYVDEDHVVVADIAQDRVFIVNTTSEIVTWAWDAQSAYPPAASGGPYPSDWTHINDVEVLPDGRIMVSVRNQDRVEFLDREDGVEWHWELGREDQYETLYEQHNPDYIPSEQGGPAVLVADSENNRLVEYQRRGDHWERTWVWYDDRLQWPRDADRLPNGNTLVSDSNGDRVFEVDDDGEVVWQMEVAFPYEAERLETGPESTGGPSATQAGLEGRDGNGSATNREAGGEGVVSNSIPAKLVRTVPGANVAMWMSPSWVGHTELVVLALIVLLVLVWAAIEWYWSGFALAVTTPVGVHRE